jgi:hypothetical protein
MSLPQSHDAIGKAHDARKGRRVLGVPLVIAVVQEKCSVPTFEVVPMPIGNARKKTNTSSGMADHKKLRRVERNNGDVGWTGKPNGIRNDTGIARIGREGQAGSAMAKRPLREAMNVAMPARIPGGVVGFEKIPERFGIAFRERSADANKRHCTAWYGADKASDGNRRKASQEFTAAKIAHAPAQLFLCDAAE